MSVAQAGIGYLECKRCDKRVPILYKLPADPSRWKVLHWLGHRIWRRR